MKHDLKTWPDFYDRVITRSKRFELRKDDRGFRVGDTLVLREWSPDTGSYTGNACTVKVTDIVRDAPQWGLEPGYCIMSITEPLS